jgi:hypothetical protein
MREGFLLGTRVADSLDFRYVQLRKDGSTATGHCVTQLEVLADGRVRLNEMGVPPLKRAQRCGGTSMTRSQPAGRAAASAHPRERADNEKSPIGLARLPIVTADARAHGHATRALRLDFSRDPDRITFDEDDEEVDFRGPHPAFKEDPSRQGRARRYPCGALSAGLHDPRGSRALRAIDTRLDEGTDGDPVSALVVESA